MRKKEKKSVVSIVIKAIIALLVAPILIISSVIVIKGAKYPDKVPDFMGYKPFIVLSGSMETSIYTGDLVFVKMCEPETLKINDIIAFRNEENTVTTHRIIDVVEQDESVCFKTKGDNNSSEDTDLVKADTIEGIYVFKISGLGNILVDLKEPKSLIIILLIILLGGFACMYVAGKLDDKKENNAKEDEHQ